MVAGIVATQLPGAIAVTFSWKMHCPSTAPTWAGIVPAVRNTVEVPGVAALTVKPHVFVMPAGLAIVIWAGKTSVTAAAVSGTSDVFAMVTL